MFDYGVAMGGWGNAPVPLKTAGAMPQAPATPISNMPETILIFYGSARRGGQQEAVP